MLMAVSRSILTVIRSRSSQIEAANFRNPRPPLTRDAKRDEGSTVHSRPIDIIQESENKGASNGFGPDAFRFSFKEVRLSRVAQISLCHPAGACGVGSGRISRQ